MQATTSMISKKHKIIIHIGQHKTGSKALQFYLAKISKSLSKNGFCYPIKDVGYKKILAYRNSHYRFYILLRIEALKTLKKYDLAQQLFLSQKEFLSPHYTIYDFFNSKLLQRSRQKCKTTILSAEDLFDMHTAHELEFSPELLIAGIKILSELLDQYTYDAKIVIYLRRQDHLLIAHYAQYIKGSGVNDIDFWNFFEKFKARLQTWEILSYWISAFDTKKITVIPYDCSTHTFDSVAFFLNNILGKPNLYNKKNLDCDVESVNQTPHRDYIEFLRIMNRRSLQKLITFDRVKLLESAFSFPSKKMVQDNFKSWLSNAEQKKILNACFTGNQKIDTLFFQGKKIFFNEEKEVLSITSKPYCGLTAERALDIALNLLTK